MTESAKEMRKPDADFDARMRSRSLINDKMCSKKPSAEAYATPKKSKKEKALWSGAAAAMRAMLSLTVLMLITPVISQLSAEFILEGFKTAVTRVLPTSLPFMVIADWYVAKGGADELPLLGGGLSKALCIPRCAVAAYICGNLCGFPIGARSIGELYLSGRIDRQRSELLLPICSNPSAAFIIGFVGGLFGSLKCGILLLVCVHLSAFICGVLLRKNRYDRKNYDNIQKQKFDLVESISKSATSSLTLIGYISIFACITGTTASLLNNAAACYVLFAITEVTGGVLHIASSGLPMALRFCAVGFTLAFGGVCVMMQSRALVCTDELSFRPYFFIKLLQGAICALLCLAAFFCCGNSI